MLNADFAATTRSSASRVPRAQSNRIPQAVPSTTNQAFHTIGSQVATNQSRSVAMPTGRMLDAGIAVTVSTSIVLPRRSAPFPTSPPSPTFGTRIAQMAASDATRMAFTRSAASVERDLSRTCRAQGKRRQRRHAHGPRMVRRRCLPSGIRRASWGILVAGLMGFMRHAGFAVKASSRPSIAPGGWTQPLSLFDGLHRRLDYSAGS